MKTKKKSFSILMSVLLVGLIIACVPFCFAGCGDNDDTNSVNRFIGSYSSVYIDMDTAQTYVKFGLQIKEDKTFIFNRYTIGSTGSFDQIGKWCTVTNEDVTTMICLLENKKGYFELTFNDQGQLLAVPEIYSSSTSGPESVFGTVGNIIQLVVFERV